MTDDSTVPVRATLETREAAYPALEPLVQQHSMAKPGIFIQSASDRRAAGTAPMGGMPRMPRVRGVTLRVMAIEMLADIALSQVAALRRSLADDRALWMSNP